MALGYRRIGKLEMQPPEYTREEMSPGVYRYPKHALYTDVVIRFTMLGRVRVLFGGNLQVVNIVWIRGDEPLPPVAGDYQQFEVVPPSWLKGA